MEHMKWLETSLDVAGLTIKFSEDLSSGELPVVTLLLRTGEVLTLTGLSLSSQPLQEQGDCVLSVTLATAVLTRLLSSWTESVIRTTAVQPNLLTTFLMSCEMITQAWSQMAVDAVTFANRKHKLPWHRRT